MCASLFSAKHIFASSTDFQKQLQPTLNVASSARRVKLVRHRFPCLPTYLCLAIYSEFNFKYCPLNFKDFLLICLVLALGKCVHHFSLLNTFSPQNPSQEIIAPFFKYCLIYTTSKIGVAPFPLLSHLFVPGHLF